MKGSLNIRIEKATISDIEPFWHFFRKNIKTQFPEYSRKAKNYFLRKSYSKKNFQRWLKKKWGILLFAQIEDKIIGYLFAEPPYGGAVLLPWMAIDKDFQKKGIGSLLLKRYETFAKKHRIHIIFLWTQKRDFKFYRKNGYVLIGCLPRSFFKVDHWLFYKTI